MIFPYSSYDNITAPSFVLCRPSGERIGVLICTEKHMEMKFNDYNEISFTTYLYNDGVKNPVYDNVKELMIIELPTIGRFVINQIDTVSEGTEFEYKDCTALSEEVLLAQKYLELFTINMGTTESIDGVSFYNLSDPEKSLLHLILEKCPDWSIGHVDNALYTMERCFEIDRTDIYSFLMDDVSTAFECIFEFDTINHLINVYEESTIGDDTNIYVSYNNLVMNTNISSSTDDIKTCLTVTGADDLGLREVNMGYDRIYNLEYFHTTEYMSQGLYDAYTAWKNLWNSQVTKYEQLVTQYQNYYNQIHELESTKMPDDPDSTNWTLYGLNPLKEKLAAYEQTQAVMIKAGQGEPSHKDYESMYLPCYNAIQAIKAQITVVENQIKALEDKQALIGEQMNDIITLISMDNNFTPEQLEELTKFIREDELSSDNFVVTDVMTEAERMDMLHEMLEYGQAELAKVAQPVLNFSMDMGNIYAIPEFNNISDYFQPGNYIHCSLRDDYIVKLRILTISINFFDESDFSVTFGNIMRLKSSQIFEDVTNALEMASSAATSVSFNASNWNQANVDSTEIGAMLADGLLAAGQRLSTTQSDVVIDDRGVVIQNNPNSKYANDTIFIGGGQILFSDDNLKTIKTALGRVQYTKQGKTYDDFGLLAQFVIAGYIAGSVIEGNTIIAGTITGTEINNGNGTFKVDANGNLTATSATVKGKIQADSGYIGGSNGFTIASGKMYSGSKSSYGSTAAGVYVGTDGIALGQNSPFKVTSGGALTATSADITGTIKATAGYIGGSNGFTIASGKMYSGSKSSFASNSAGVYMGTDGIALGTNSPFKVDSNGNLTATSGTLGGIRIGSNSIYSNNGNFSISSDGYAVFKNVLVTGVNQGSTFGGITYNANGTSGNFNYGFSAGHGFDVTGGAWNDFKDLVVDSITAKQVLAEYITAGEVSANYATISSLNAANARIDNLSSASINVNRLTAGTVNGYSVSWRDIHYVSYITVSFKDGYVSSVTPTTRALYVMAHDEAYS